MKTGEDFRNAFPETEEGFRQAALNALEKLREGEVHPVKGKLRMVMTLALMLTLLTTVGLATQAERLGLLDFFRKEDGLLQPARSIETEVPQYTSEAQGEYAVYTVREGLYDGVNQHVALDIELKDEKALLIYHSLAFTPNEVDLMEEPCCWNPHMTNREYYEQGGYDAVYAMRITNALGGIFPLVTHDLQYEKYVHNTDGSYTLMLTGKADQTSVSADKDTIYGYLSTFMAPVEAGKNPSVLLREKEHHLYVYYRLTRAPEVEYRKSRIDQPQWYQNIGVEVQWMELSRTEVTTCLTIYAQDMVRSDKHVRVRILNEKGKEIARVRELWYQKGAFSGTIALDTLPDEIIVELSANGVSPEAHTFRLHPKE